MAERGAQGELDATGERDVLYVKDAWCERDGFQGDQGALTFRKKAVGNAGNPEALGTGDSGVAVLPFWCLSALLLTASVGGGRFPMLSERALHSICQFSLV